MNLRAFDLETTGLDVTAARIWQVATDSREWLVNPGVPIPPDIRELSRIDDALLQCIDAAPPWADIEREVLEHQRDCDALVTQNGPRYDVPVLEAHTGLSWQSLGLPPVLDVRVLAFEAWPNLENHKLGTVALALNQVTAEELEQKVHDARFDCASALRVFQLLPAKWIADIDRLLEFQARAVELHDRDWRDYGVATADGPKFLWFRTCRACRGTPGQVCRKCDGRGFVHHTLKRRGQPVDDGFLRWLRGKDSCPGGIK